MRRLSIDVCVSRGIPLSSVRVQTSEGSPLQAGVRSRVGVGRGAGLGIGGADEPREGVIGKRARLGATLSYIEIESIVAIGRGVGPASAFKICPKALEQGVGASRGMSER